MSLFVALFLFVTQNARMGCPPSLFVDYGESDFASSVICRSCLGPDMLCEVGQLARPFHVDLLNHRLLNQ